MDTMTIDRIDLLPKTPRGFQFFLKKLILFVKSENKHMGYSCHIITNIKHSLTYAVNRLYDSGRLIPVFVRSPWHKTNNLYGFTHLIIMIHEVH